MCTYFSEHFVSRHVQFMSPFKVRHHSSLSYKISSEIIDVCLLLLSLLESIRNEKSVNRITAGPSTVYSNSIMYLVSVCYNFS